MKIYKVKMAMADGYTFEIYTDATNEEEAIRKALHGDKTLSLRAVEVIF